MEQVNISIDEEFKSLLPALDKETYALLEENLKENGCRDSLVLWNGILIDGHNRYEICTKHDIPFNTVDKEFTSREEVLIWIISTQVSRRNLTPMQLSNYRGLHYKADKKIQGTYDRFMPKIEKLQNATFQGSTANRLANQYNVSRDTIIRDAKVAESLESIGEVSPEAKRMILSGEVKINKKELEAIASGSKEEIAEIALEIEEGRYEKKKAASPAGSGVDLTHPEAQPPQVVVSSITDDFSAELRKLVKSGDTAELKTALRSYIDMLEDLYRRM
jgi:hypothetical protein